MVPGASSVFKGFFWHFLGEELMGTEFVFEDHLRIDLPAKSVLQIRPGDTPCKYTLISESNTFFPETRE